MTNTEILTRLTRYALDALEAANKAHEYHGSGATDFARGRARAAYEATKLEARWAKGEIVLTDQDEADMEALWNRCEMDRLEA